jgi:hypothetical protein
MIDWVPPLETFPPMTGKRYPWCDVQGNDLGSREAWLAHHAELDELEYQAAAWSGPPVTARRRIKRVLQWDEMDCGLVHRDCYELWIHASLHDAEFDIPVGEIIRGWSEIGVECPHCGQSGTYTDGHSVELAARRVEARDSGGNVGPRVIESGCSVERDPVSWPGSDLVASQADQRFLRELVFGPGGY